MLADLTGCLVGEDASSREQIEAEAASLSLVALQHYIDVVAKLRSGRQTRTCHEVIMMVNVGPNIGRASIHGQSLVRAQGNEVDRCSSRLF